MIKILTERKAQIGETVTWVVATVIIILILGVSIFLASARLDERKDLGDAFFQSEDTLASKSFFSYVLTENGEGSSVYEQLKTLENLDEVNGEFALNIFRDYYQDDYVKIWLGLRKKGDFNISSPVTNDYFPFRGDKSIPVLGQQNIFENIVLSDEKSAALILTPFELPGLGGFG